MAARREPIFLGRETYRRRRLIDAMRLLPVVGGLFFLSPLLGSDTETRSTAMAGIFLFSAWFGLILLSAILVRVLARAPGGVGADPLDPDTPPATEDTRDPGRGAR